MIYCPDCKRVVQENKSLEIEGEYRTSTMICSICNVILEVYRRYLGKDIKTA